VHTKTAGVSEIKAKKEKEAIFIVVHVFRLSDENGCCQAIGL
jgi:hypothetical protein